MRRELRFSPTANAQLTQLENDLNLKGVLKQVRKTLAYLEADLRVKSLQTHKYESLSKRYKREIFEAYVQQDAPSAYRVFWHYGDDEVDEKGKRIPIITVIAITPHPD